MLYISRWGRSALSDDFGDNRSVFLHTGTLFYEVGQGRCYELFLSFSSKNWYVVELFASMKFDEKDIRSKK